MEIITSLTRTPEDPAFRCEHRKADTSGILLPIPLMTHHSFATNLPLTAELQLEYPPRNTYAFRTPT